MTGQPLDRQTDYVGSEFRVVWQREGYDKRRKIFGRRAAAERYVKRLQGDHDPFPDRDDDDYACCSGWECGCYGVSVAQAREQERQRYAAFPPIVYGPELQERPVGSWETLTKAEPAPYPARPEPEPIAVGSEAFDDVPF
jgi:hypothetical protein